MRVLLIRLRLIGDVVLSTPVIRALRRAFPDATLTYLVERDAAAVVAGNRDLDRIIVVERTRGLRRVLDDAKLAWQLRRDRYDVVIDMHGGPRSSWLTLATGAPAADRLRHARPAVDVHAGPSRAPASSVRATRS